MQGTFVIISAPSGGGKNTVIAELVRRLPNAARFVTTTTRLPRGIERDGQDYYFLDEKTFLEKKDGGDFLETNFYAGHWYGTDREHLGDALQRHAIVFGALDVNGKRQLSAAGVPHLSIFLLPEDMATLEKRIRRRGGLTDEEVLKRLETAREEIAAAGEYDSTVVNPEGHLPEAVDGVFAILDKSSAR
jgi:guanylate kinase